MLTFTEVKNRWILLDSNIPIHYASSGFRERSGNPLRLLADGKNTIGITPISGLEILTQDNRPEVDKKYLDFLNYVPNVQMRAEYFQNAQMLARTYKQVLDGKKMGIPDLLIGAVVVSHSVAESKPLLLTADRSDFCEPLWLTIAYHHVSADAKNKGVTFYLLEFNTDILENRKPTPLSKE